MFLNVIFSFFVQSIFLYTLILRDRNFYYVDYECGMMHEKGGSVNPLLPQIRCFYLFS